MNFDRRRIKPAFIVLFSIITLSVGGWIYWSNLAPERVAVTMETIIRINKVQATYIPKLDGIGESLANLQKSSAGGPLRYYFKTGNLQIADIDTGKIKAAGHVFKPEEYGFDLWSIASDLQAPPDSAIVLFFELTSDQLRKAHLGLGASHQFGVFVNGKLKHASLGVRSILFNQDICTIDLSEGVTEIGIVFQRVSRWNSIPKDHFQPEWSAEIQVFGSAQAAWDSHLRSVFRPLDTPILPTINELRLEAVVEPWTSVRLFDLHGVEVGRGHAQPDGKVVWDSGTTLQGRTLSGFLELGGRVGEPFLILGEKTIEEAIETLVPPSVGADVADAAWSFRLRHMLKPEFKSERNRTWARKVVQALTMATLGTDKPQLDRFRQKSPSLRIQLHSFTSKIDGTTQYFHLFKCSKRDGKIPMVVMLPSVPENVRPYLQSATISNLAALESTAVMAEQMNVDVLWPGIVDVDYGGLLCQKAVSECLQAASAIYGAPRSGGIYLSGICSSGVSAINCSRTIPGISGVILQTPVIVRNIPKVPNDIASFDTLFPSDALIDEAKEGNLEHFKRTPVFMIFDTAMPGHGDMNGARAFEEKLKGLGANIESHWPPLGLSMPWGERENVRTRQWMKWIHEHESEQSTEPHKEQEQASAAPTSVKDAILRGFQITSLQDPFFAKWQKSWESCFELYRGGAYVDRTIQDASTLVTFRVLSPTDRKGKNIDRLMMGRPLLRTKDTAAVDIAETDRLFGVRLLGEAKDNKNVVELFRTDFGDIQPPRIDLILDGHFKAAVWKFERDSWVLLEVWL